MDFTCYRGNYCSPHFFEEISHDNKTYLLPTNKKLNRWEWKRSFMKLISARTDSWSQWALCGMWEVHVKWAAVPGWNTSICLTRSWKLLSSWGKQVHPRLFDPGFPGLIRLEKEILRTWKILYIPVCWFLGHVEVMHGKTVSVCQM